MLTINQIHDLIAANPQAKAEADKGNDNGVVAIMQPLMPYEPVEGSLAWDKTILEAFENPFEGSALIGKMQTEAVTNPLLKIMMPWLTSGAAGIDFGKAPLRAFLTSLKNSGKITQTELDKLLRLGEKQVSISSSDVAAAWSRYRKDTQAPNQDGE